MEPPSPSPDVMCMERLKLNKESRRIGQHRYFVFFNDDDARQFDAYIVGPDTGVYRFKLVKLHLNLPDQFPKVPPQIRFIHNTRHQIHPNFFPSGNICFSLIGDHDHDRWKSQDWKPRKICHRLLLYIRDLLDDNPFKREPWGQDNPELSRFVQYVTWEALLLNYIDTETNIIALALLRAHVLIHGVEMLRELWKQRAADPGREYFTSPFHERVPADYLALARKLSAAVARARLPPPRSSPRAGIPTWELELRGDAAWTWAGQVSLKWSRLFSTHGERELWGQHYRD